MPNTQRLSFLRPQLKPLNSASGRRHVDPAKSSEEKSKVVVPAHPIGKKRLEAENKIDHFQKPEIVPITAGKMPAHGRFHAVVPRAFERPVHYEKTHTAKKTYHKEENSGGSEAKRPPYVPGEYTAPKSGRKPQTPRGVTSSPIPNIFDENRESRETPVRGPHGRGRSPARGTLVPRDASFGGATPVSNPITTTTGRTPSASGERPIRKPSPFKPVSSAVGDRLKLATSTCTSTSSATNGEAVAATGRRRSVSAPRSGSVPNGSSSSGVAALIGGSATAARAASRAASPARSEFSTPMVGKRVHCTQVKVEPPPQRYQGPTQRHPVPTPYSSQIFDNLKVGENGSGSSSGGKCLYDFKFISNAIVKPEMSTAHSVPQRRASTPTHRTAPHSFASFASGVGSVDGSGGAGASTAVESTPPRRATSGGRARTPLGVGSGRNAVSSTPVMGSAMKTVAPVASSGRKQFERSGSTSSISLTWQ